MSKLLGYPFPMKFGLGFPRMFSLYPISKNFIIDFLLQV